METKVAEPTNLLQARDRRGHHANHHCDCFVKYIHLQDISRAGKQWKQTCKACPGKVVWGAILTYLKTVYYEVHEDYERFTCSCEDSDLHSFGIRSKSIYDAYVTEWADSE